jgi:U3 small nucleolar RNA-associated protein 7
MAEIVDVVDQPTAKVHFNGAIPIQRSKSQVGLPRREEQKKIREREANKAYGRGKKIDVKGVRDKKLRRNLSTLEQKYKTATGKAKDAEILLENTGGFLEPETELERTWKVGQKQIVADSTVETAQKRFELKLEALGPYVCEYSRNGRHLLLAGRKGHVSTMDWREGKLGCELQLGETVRDAKWLHNNQYFAVSQKNHVYIYDNRGVELHCLKQHREVTHMEFLPYHFLLGTLVSLLPRGVITVQLLTFASPHKAS